MRLVRIALANVNTTVGAVPLQRRPRHRRWRAPPRPTGRRIVALPEQIIGGYPPEDLVQWRAFVDAQRAELARFARETAALGCASVVGLVVARGAHLYNVAALVHAGRVWGYRPEGEAARSTTSSTRRARSRAARRASTTSLDGVPVRRPDLRPRLRRRGPRGLRGRLVARRADAPPLLRGRGARRQRERVALSRRASPRRGAR